MALIQKDIAKNVTSAADFEQILQMSFAHKGVCVLDVYSSEWGPCKAISETFRRLYTDSGDAVHLRFFTVECNAVLEALRTEDPAIARHMRKNTENLKETLPDFWAPILEKRRGKSKPFFVMYKEGRKVQEVEGVNTPLLRAYVKDLCTVKTPAAEFITQPKLLEFWDSHFNPDESEVSIEKFLKALNVVCKLAAPLTEEEKVILYEAIGIRKDAKEKVVTAENLQKWVGDDDTRTMQLVFAETLPDYEVRAAAARALREEEERKNQEKLRKEREEHERKEQEAREAAEAERKKAEEQAVAESFKTYKLPDTAALERLAPAQAVAEIDNECSRVMANPHVKEHVSRVGAADDRAETFQFIQSTVADAANVLGQRRIKSASFVSIAQANEQINQTVAALTDASPLLFRSLAETQSVPPTRVAAASLALSNKAGGVDAKASAINCLARALAVSSAEDSAKLFGLDHAFVDFAESVQKGTVVAEFPTLAAYLLLSCTEQAEPRTYYATLKPDAVPEAAVEVVIPALSILSATPPENVPENRVCIAVKGIPRIIDLSAKNGQQLVASAWFFKGQISTSESASGFTTFVVSNDHEFLGDETAVKQLTKNWESNSRIPEDTFLRAFHHLCLLRQMRTAFVANVQDPFWVKFNERLPHQPRDAVKELFNSMDGDHNGGLTVAEVVSGVSHALEVPSGDDISDAVTIAFKAVSDARAAAGKTWSGSATNKVGAFELSLVIQHLRLYYELMAKFPGKNLETKHEVRNISPEEVQAALSVDLSEEEMTMFQNGKCTFDQLAAWYIKKGLDLNEEDDAPAEGEHGEL